MIWASWQYSRTISAILFRITMVPANPGVPLESHEVAPETKGPL